jgi:hypothetical protein
VRSLGLALCLSNLSGLSGLYGRSLSALNCTVACAFAVMLTYSSLSSSADESPSTTLPPRSAAMVSKLRVYTSRSATRSSPVRIFLALKRPMQASRAYHVEGSPCTGLLCRWGVGIQRTDGTRSLSTLWGRCVLHRIVVTITLCSRRPPATPAKSAVGLAEVVCFVGVDAMDIGSTWAANCFTLYVSTCSYSGRCSGNGVEVGRQNDAVCHLNSWTVFSCVVRRLK